MAASKELEKLVSSIEERCCFEPAGFDAEGIKQHILDIFNERRRQLRRGHDYTLVSSIKKLWFFSLDSVMQNRGVPQLFLLVFVLSFPSPLSPCLQQPENFIGCCRAYLTPSSRFDLLEQTSH